MARPGEACAPSVTQRESLEVALVVGHHGQKRTLPDGGKP